jgi:hypothetical protein
MNHIVDRLESDKANQTKIGKGTANRTVHDRNSFYPALVNDNFYRHTKNGERLFVEKGVFSLYGMLFGRIAS